MQIKQYFLPILKWWWLIVLSTITAAVTNYWVVDPLPPVYLAHTTIMVGRAIADPNPSGNEFMMAQQLAIYYTNLVMREPVRVATQKALGIETLPKYSAQTVPNSPFIEIAVTDTDPNRAAIVANQLAEQLILQSPSASQDDPGSQEFIQQQLSKMQQSIIETEKELEQKQIELTQLSSASQIEDLQAEIAALETKHSLLQQNYTNLLANTRSGAVNSLTIIEVASVPTIPIGPKKLLIFGVSTLGGMLLAIGIAFLLEFLDRTIKTAEDVTRFFNVPVIGYIQKMARNNQPATLVVEQPRSPITEAFRVLRINLGFISVSQPSRTLLISSANKSEGKTTIATNLALSLAQMEKKVILLDADLRRPNIHKNVNLPSQPGLTDAFQGELQIEETLHSYDGNVNLRVIPAGKIPPNPTDLLNSPKMERFLDALVQAADLIILDGPPFIVPDTAILASKVDGVLLVIQPGQITYDMAKNIVAQLERAGGKLIGVVFNKVKSQGMGAYAYQIYADEEDIAIKKPSIFSNIKLPAFKLPAIKLPSLKWPAVKLPNLRFRKFTPPTLKFSKPKLRIRLPKFKNPLKRLDD